MALRLGEALGLIEARDALEETVGSVVGTLVVRDVAEGLTELPMLPLAAPAGLPLDKGPLGDGEGEVVVQGVGEREGRKWEGLAVGEAPSDAVGPGGVAVVLIRPVAVERRKVGEVRALAVSEEVADAQGEVMGEAVALLLAEEQGEGLPEKSELALKEALLLLQAEAGNVGEGVVLAQGNALGVGEVEEESVNVPDALELALPPLALGVDTELPVAPEELLPLLLLHALPLPWLLLLPLALLKPVVEPVAQSVPAPALGVWLLQPLAL